MMQTLPKTTSLTLRTKWMMLHKFHSTSLREFYCSLTQTHLLLSKWAMGGFFCFSSSFCFSVFHSLLLTWFPPPPTWCPKLKHGTLRAIFEPKIYLLRACWGCMEETSKPEFPVRVCVWVYVCVCVFWGALFQNHSIKAGTCLPPHAAHCGPMQAPWVIVALCSVTLPVLFSFHRWF